MAKSCRPLVLLAPLLLLAAGCGRPAGPPPEPPPPAVTVAEPVSRPVTEYRDYTGRIEAVEAVDVRARVRGFLEKIHFKEGVEVQQGDLLYTIDPKPFQAALDQVEAEVRRLDALVRQTESEAQRVIRLRGTGAVTQEEVIAREAARDEARANLEKSKAAVAAARLDLGYTQVRAPIGGRIGRTLVTEGNLVGYNEPTLLTTIVRVDPVYVTFEAPERDFLDYQQLIREHNAPTAAGGEIPLQVGLVTEKGYPHPGVLRFRDNRVDPGTGTILLRGTLPNPDRGLTPGLYARVRVPFGPPRPRLLVPVRALAADQRGRYVLIVAPDDTVEYRPVVTGIETEDGLVAITEGLKPGERVVVNGLQRARPGGKVRGQETGVMDSDPRGRSGVSPAGAAGSSPGLTPWGP
jgi:RND family efflux transporter MFP subunit